MPSVSKRRGGSTPPPPGPPPAAPPPPPPPRPPPPAVAPGLPLGVGARVLGDVGGRVAARVEGDRAVAAREEAHLRPPALPVARELVDEQERRPLPPLVAELPAADVGRGHRLASLVVHAQSRARPLSQSRAWRGLVRSRH